MTVDDDTDDTDESEGEAPERTSLFERFVPPVDLLDEDGEPKPSRMTQHEQMVAVALGFANVAIAAAAASAMETQQGLALLAGVVASALTIAGARVGNRILTMLGLFASVVTRSGDTIVFLAFGLPYYAAALWMFMKYNRLVKAQGLRRRQERAAARGARGATAGAGRPSGKGKKGEAPAAKARPTASKRYTPPKPVKKRPPPPPKPPRDRSPVD